MIEDFLLRPVNIETEDDVRFLTALSAKMAARENNRDVQPLFSPSALGSCLRRVYFQRHWRELGMVRQEPLRTQPHFYFLTGNFLHLKWQFCLFKMMQAGVKGIKPLEIDDVEPRWCEVPIISKRGDHGGTVDVALEIFEVPMIIDFKGLNVRMFSEITRNIVPSEYEIQLSDYMILYNSHPRRKTERIERSLLVVENKGGPDNNHPAALHEVVIDLDDHKPEVRNRLEELRQYESDEEIPPPECQSTRGFQFQGCPFQAICKEEVREVERRNSARSDSKGYQVAVPGRNGNRRSRRNSKRRS